jgi:hypothetical protein
VSRFWLVELHEDLEHLPLTATTAPTDRFGVWNGVRSVNGVKQLTDMEVVSFETLEELLRPTDPELIRLWRRQRAERAKESTAST